MAIAAHFVEQLAARRRTALAAGGEEKLKARKEKGLMNARERLLAFYQPNTFMEWGMHADHDCHDFGLEGKSFPGDGVVTGVGYVEGRPVAAFSHDFTVGGGALGRIHSKKICDLMDYAMKAGMPVLGINDSGGARIQEGDESLSGYGQVFFRNVQASGLVPQISIIAGPCAGGAAYSPALTDFVIMTKTNANMFICGPDVIKAATGQTVTMDEVGSATVHATVNGNIHFVADNDAHALQLARKLLSFLPNNNAGDPLHKAVPQLDLSPDPVLNDLVPSDPKAAVDILKVITRLVDEGDFFEVQRDWAKNIVIGFGRIQGIVCGIVANQSAVKAGTLDIDSSDKAARFIRTCNVYSIPLVTLVDIPGFMPGLQQERGGIIRHGAKMLFAYAAATVPKLTVILRKAYGGAFLAMCSKDVGAETVLAWPTAEIAVMGPEGAARVLYRKEINAAADPAAVYRQKVAEYREQYANPFRAAEELHIDDIIRPAWTRRLLIERLGLLRTKRDLRPQKKHGNMPL
jgi:propionyl-CoA carboxylase beta chain